MNPIVHTETQAPADPLAEQLSAFLDGELPERELDLLLKRLDRDPQLRSTLSCYAAIGESLRGRPQALVQGGFADRVCAALAQERAVGGGASGVSVFAARWGRKAAKAVGGVAIAAAVAGASLFILQRQSLLPGGSPQPPLQADASPTSTVVIGSVSATEPPSYTVTLPTAPNPIVPAARLTDYVIAHSEYSSPLGRRSMLSGAIAEDPTPVEVLESASVPVTGASSP